MDCGFRDQMPGKKRCFRHGSIAHIVNDCTLPKQTNTALTIIGNHSDFDQGNRIHKKGDWYRKDKEHLGILLIDIVNGNLQHGVSFPDIYGGR